MSSAREPKDLELPQGSEVVAGSDLPRDGDELNGDELKRPHAPVLIAPPNAPGIGRGSGATNPAWMSHDQPDAPPPKRRRGQTDVHTDANAREDGIHTAPDAPAPETARADTSAAAVGTALEAARAVSTSPVAPEAAHAAAHFDEVDEEDDETVDDVSQCSNLIVNYLPHTVGETELRRLFAPHGTIQHVKVVTDRGSGKSKGFGFVRFSTDQEALEAIASKNGLEFGRKRIKVRGELTVSRTFLAPATLPARLSPRQHLRLSPPRARTRRSASRGHRVRRS